MSFLFHFDRLFHVSRAILILVFSALLFGCGEREPGVPVDDPRAYAIKKLAQIEHRTWWAPYRNTDPAFLAAIVDDVSGRIPDGLPTDSKRLDRLVKGRIAGKYRSENTGSEENRMKILAKAEARYANPPMAVHGSKIKVALLDFHYLPGEWKTTSRTGMGMLRPPALERLGFLTREALHHALKHLQEAYPDIRIYQIRFRYFMGGTRKHCVYQIAKDGSFLIKEGTSQKFTEESIPWSDLIAGRITPSELKWDTPMQDRPGPKLYTPDREPLPMSGR